MKRVINPNRPFTAEQMEQIEAQLGEVEVLEASVNFPLASDGGMAEAAYASAMSYPDEVPYWYPTGLGTGAAAVVATLHGRYRSQFPDIMVFAGPPAYPFMGMASLNEVRNEARQTRYGGGQEETPAEADTVVLNFSHNFSPAQREEILALLGKDVEEVEFREDLSLHYTYTCVEDLIGMVQTQVTEVGMSAKDWQEVQVVVNLPAHSGGAMLALADMHGRMGYFPTVLRVERAEDGFHYTEAIDLEELRLKALKERQADKVLVDRNDLAELIKLYEGVCAVAIHSAQVEVPYDLSLVERLRANLE